MDEPYLFEISWEVCNKVGGIYTVIISKTAEIKNIFQKYVAVGPYFPEKHASEFVEESVPKEFAKAFDAYVAACNEAIGLDVEEEVEVAVPLKPDVRFKVDLKYCEKFSGGRRTRCIVEQRRHGQRYQQSQSVAPRR